MVRVTTVVIIVNTPYRFTVNADGLAWMRNSACKAVAASLMKALAASAVAVTSMLSAYHDIALATAMVFVIGTV